MAHSPRRSTFATQIDEFRLEEEDTRIDPVAINSAINLIPKFDGKPSELNKFIYTVDTLRKGSNSATASQLLKIALTKLEGSAFNYIRNTENLLWDEVKDLLISKFGERRSIPELQLELANIRQLPGESVRKYSEKIEKILGLMCDQSKTDDKASLRSLQSAHNQLALTVFINGLRPELRILIKAARHADLEDAVLMAIQEEQNLGRSGHHYGGNTKSLTTNSTAKETGAPFCKRCKIPGHQYSNCRRRTIFKVDHRPRQTMENVGEPPRRSESVPRPPSPQPRRSEDHRRSGQNKSQKN